MFFLGKMWVTSPDLKVSHPEAPEAPEAPASPASPPPESSSGSASSSSASTSSEGAPAEAGVGEWIGIFLASEMGNNYGKPIRITNDQWKIDYESITLLLVILNG